MIEENENESEPEYTYTEDEMEAQTRSFTSEQLVDALAHMNLIAKRTRKARQIIIHELNRRTRKA